MKSMVKQYYINIDELLGTCELSLDDDRNYYKYMYDRDYLLKDLVELQYKVNINYCPFCGEKINIGERVTGSPI